MLCELDWIFKMPRKNENDFERISTNILDNSNSFNRENKVEGMSVDSDSKLIEIRDKVSELDAKLLELFDERYHLMSEIYDEKKNQNLPIYVGQYEALKLHDAVNTVKDSYLKSPSKSLYKKFMQLSREAQYHRKVLENDANIDWKNLIEEALKADRKEIKSVAVLGDASSNTAEVANRLYKDVKLSSFINLRSCIEAVINSGMDAMVLSYRDIDRDTEAYIMSLFKEGSLSLIKSTVSQTNFSLMANRNSSLAKIRRVLAHPIQIKLCESFLKRFDWSIQEVSHPAFAAREVALLNDPTVAAISTIDEASRNGLIQFDTDVNKLTTTEDRYYVIAKEMRINENVNKMTLLVELLDSEASLCTLLQYISDRGYNIHRVETILSPSNNLKKMVIVDFDLRYGDERIVDLLYQLREENFDYRIVGWYERV